MPTAVDNVEKLVPVVIDVTETDIKKGWANGGSHACPIALALKRVIKRGVDISVGGDDIMFNDERSFFLPKKAAKFSLKQNGGNDGKPMKPFSFKMEFPAQYIKGQK